MSQPVPQPLLQPLDVAALFLVVTAGSDAADARAVAEVAADVGTLVRAVGFREQQGSLHCVVGIGSEFWDRLGRSSRPAELHPFAPLAGPAHEAPATAGDVLFHIQASRADLCFELGRLIRSALGGAATVVDAVSGFRYFDARDLLGFVDGTENPTGPGATAAALIGDEDIEFAGGSYVVVQKYLHDLDRWSALPSDEQERVIGRTKLDNVELDDKPSNSHVAVNTLVEADGTEREILRANMPFGSLEGGEFGTYFIGYARSPAVTEEMLRRMFLGHPPGNHDRILDFSVAVTGTLFFVPSVEVLESLAATGPGPGAAQPPARTTAGHALSLDIGELKGVPQ